MEVIELFFQDSKSDKVYRATLDGGKCKLEWGRRGSTLQCKAPFDGVTDVGVFAARAKYEEMVRDKTSKGYQLNHASRSAPAPVQPLAYTCIVGHPANSRRQCSNPDCVFSEQRNNPAPSARSAPVQPSVPGFRFVPDATAAQPIPTGRRVRPNPSLAKPLSAYQPMLLNPIGEQEAERLICDPNWYMQQKADGVRTLALIEHPIIETASRTQKPVNLPDEVKTALFSAFQVRSVIDSESCGETLVIFDILHNGAGDMREWSLEKRVDHMEVVASKAKTIGLPSLSFIQTARTEAQKRAALKALRAGGAEGVCFKLRSASYVAGRPNSLGNSLKWKWVASAAVMVTGVNVKGKRSVDIAMNDSTCQLVPVGSVSVPEKWGALDSFIGKICTCEYLYAMRGGSLIQPVFKGVREDVMLVDGLDSLQIKGEERA